MNLPPLPTLNHLRFRPGAFEIPHFLKERSAISLESSCHDSLTHWQTVTRDAARSWPPGVNVFSPLIIQVIHFSRKRSLNGLFNRHPEVGRGLSGHRVLFILKARIENLIFERLRKRVRFLSNRISFFPTSEETHNFIYLERNVSNPIFACFLCWTKITFWPLLTLFWSNSKVHHTSRS